MIIPKDELAFLQRVDELGRSGLTQLDVARALEMSAATLRYKIEKHGLELADAGTYVRAKIGRMPLAELLDTGIISPAPDEPEPVSA